jgi:hypothetical protein
MYPRSIGIHPIGDVPPALLDRFLCCATSAIVRPPLVFHPPASIWSLAARWLLTRCAGFKVNGQFGAWKLLHRRNRRQHRRHPVQPHHQAQGLPSERAIPSRGAPVSHEPHYAGLGTTSACAGKGVVTQSEEPNNCRAITGYFCRPVHAKETCTVLISTDHTRNGQGGISMTLMQGDPGQS